MFSRDGWMRKRCSQNTQMYSAKSEREWLFSSPEGRAKVNCCPPFTSVALACAERDVIFLIGALKL